MVKPSHIGTAKNGLFFVLTIVLFMLTGIAFLQGAWWWIMFWGILGLFCFILYFYTRRDANKAAGVL